MRLPYTMILLLLMISNKDILTAIFLSFFRLRGLVMKPTYSFPLNFDPFASKIGGSQKLKGIRCMLINNCVWTELVKRNHFISKPNHCYLFQ